jgi:hypothetical protein
MVKRRATNHVVERDIDGRRLRDVHAHEEAARRKKRDLAVDDLERAVHVRAEVEESARRRLVDEIARDAPEAACRVVHAHTSRRGALANLGDETIPAELPRGHVFFRRRLRL